MDSLDLEPYVDPQSRFSLGVPRGWEADTSGRQRTAVIFFHPLVDRGFRANITVLIEQTGAILPAEYLTYCRLQLKGVGASTSLVVDEEINLTPSARLLEYSITSGPLPLRVRQLICPRPGEAWVVSATALADSFDLYRRELEAILKSFRLSSQRGGP